MDSDVYVGWSQLNEFSGRRHGGDHSLGRRTADITENLARFYRPFEQHHFHAYFEYVNNRRPICFSYLCKGLKVVWWQLQCLQANVQGGLDDGHGLAMKVTQRYLSERLFIRMSHHLDQDGNCVLDHSIVEPMLLLCHLIILDSPLHLKVLDETGESLVGGSSYTGKGPTK